ncbi:ABC transporter ATP-binding protein [Lachnospiraceae bacterium KGMB03038]|nr:ABC transporter ATP-binding protein [Lachnospiraceae bacterium KGMB03038]
MLKVEHLSVSYGAIQAVRDISFEVGKGEIVSLIGNNGAGKSSTLKALTGIVKPAQGSIKLFDQEIAGVKAHKVSKLGMAMVPEGRGIFTRMTVLENLEMGAFNRPDKENVKSDLDKVFELFPVLAERRKQKGGSLSGGEQQMLAVGRAMMQNPKILLLDEPSLGLAPQVVESIFEVVKEINKKDGTPILLVEQNAYLALEVSNRGYVLETGEIIVYDESKKLLENEMVQRAYLGVED